MKFRKLFYIVTFTLLLSMVLTPTTASTYEPIYIVNGVKQISIKNIPAEKIVNIESLPIDDKLIAEYGIQANNGVMIVTIKHDKPALFSGGESFNEYILSRVEWDNDERAANIILRYIIKANGELKIDKELSSTDKRFRRRVLKVVEQAPKWTPATRSGAPVDSEGLLNILLPLGKKLPQEFELVLR